MVQDYKSNPNKYVLSNEIGHYKSEKTFENSVKNAIKKNKSFIKGPGDGELSLDFQKTLEYLEKNPHISEISGFDKVKKMKYKDIFKAYFSSAEFEESIETLKKEDESAEYIQEYFILAKNYIDYFINIDD